MDHMSDINANGGAPSFFKVGAQRDAVKDSKTNAIKRSKVSYGPFLDIVRGTPMGKEQDITVRTGKLIEPVLSFDKDGKPVMERDKNSGKMVQKVKNASIVGRGEQEYKVEVALKAAAGHDGTTLDVTHWHLGADENGEDWTTLTFKPVTKRTYTPEQTYSRILGLDAGNLFRKVNKLKTALTPTSSDEDKQEVADTERDMLEAYQLSYLWEAVKERKIKTGETLYEVEPEMAEDGETQAVDESGDPKWTVTINEDIVSGPPTVRWVPKRQGNDDKGKPKYVIQIPKPQAAAGGNGGAKPPVTKAAAPAAQPAK
jgi:hypothetical protein